MSKLPGPNLDQYVTEHSRERGYMRGWTPPPDTIGADVIEATVKLIEEWRREDLLPASFRRITYRLLTSGLKHRGYGVPFSALSYVGGRSKSRTITGKDNLKYQIDAWLPKAQRAGIIKWADIDDDRIQEVLPDGIWDSEKEYREALLRGIREFELDLQIGQPTHQCLWMEAKGSIKLVSRIANERGVPVYSSGGNVSAGAQRNAALWAVRDWNVTRRPQIIWQIGDFDGAGVTDFHAFRENVLAFAHAHQPKAEIYVSRMMLNWKQASDPRWVHPAAYEPVKATKAEHWPATHTHMAQVDAVEDKLFRREVQRNLNRYFDDEKRDEVLETQRVARLDMEADIAAGIGEDEEE